MNNPEVEMELMLSFLEQINQHGLININNDRDDLIVSMTPDNQEQLIVEKQNIKYLMNKESRSISKLKLAESLLKNGDFQLNNDRSAIQYRCYYVKHVYMLEKWDITKWSDILMRKVVEKSCRRNKNQA
ncbi:unnamed protein product [Didymodactylos carnosus]|uniref:Uncharacterized protein n=1 Tax=Didymodactylos carnosus TaxID=1234261 RepID=A0A816CYC6_9BILA|nr:unnamed protein product [Didymodactylos carnosus]CAF4520180.1 unnamed protein product [Didymodactylos carnosus]